MSDVTIENELVLPCGVRIKNRLCKAAMTEGLADPAIARQPNTKRFMAVGPMAAPVFY